MTSWIQGEGGPHIVAIRKAVRRLLRTRLDRRRPRALARRLYRLLHAAIARAYVGVYIKETPENRSMFPEAIALIERAARDDLSPQKSLAEYDALRRLHGGIGGHALSIIEDGLAGRDRDAVHCTTLWHHDHAWNSLDRLLLQDMLGDRDVTREILDDLLPDTLPVLAPDALAWQNGTVVTLARSIVAGHDFASLPILGDALEDAGCADAALMAHCRGPGPHYLGCYALETILAASAPTA